MGSQGVVDVECFMLGLSYGVQTLSMIVCDNIRCKNEGVLIGLFIRSFFKRKLYKGQVFRYMNPEFGTWSNFNECCVNHLIRTAE